MRPDVLTCSVFGSLRDEPWGPLSLPSWETGELLALDLTQITPSSYLLPAPVLWTWHSLLLPHSL